MPSGRMPAGRLTVSGASGRRRGSAAARAAPVEAVTAVAAVTAARTRAPRRERAEGRGTEAEAVMNPWCAPTDARWGIETDERTTFDARTLGAPAHRRSRPVSRRGGRAPRPPPPRTRARRRGRRDPRGPPAARPPHDPRRSTPTPLPWRRRPPP